MRTVRDVDQQIADLGVQRGGISETIKAFADATAERFLLEEQQKTIARQLDSCLEEKNLLGILQRETEQRELLQKQEAQLKELRQKEDFQKADAADKERQARDLIEKQERERQEFFKQQDRDKQEALQKQDKERQDLQKSEALEKEKQQKEQFDREASQRENAVSEIAADVGYAAIKAADVLLEIKQSIELELEKAAFEKDAEARREALRKEADEKAWELQQRLIETGRDGLLPELSKKLAELYAEKERQLELELANERLRLFEAQAREAAERSQRAARDGMSL